VKVTAANRAGAVHRGRGFLRLEAKALRNGDDVIGESFVPRSGSGVGRRGRRAVRGEEAVRGCFPDLLGCPLEREIAGGVGRRQDTNAARMVFGTLSFFAASPAKRSGGWTSSSVLRRCMLALGMAPR
jgi:hypothetical protein